jgi:hypothetical protein
MLGQGTNIVRIIFVYDNEGNKYDVKAEISGNQFQEGLMNLQKNKTPIFLVTSTKENWFVEKDSGKWINLSRKIVILFPESMDKWEVKKPKDFAFDVFLLKMDSPKREGYPVYLGSLIKDIKNITSDKDFSQQYGKPNDIAQALGYTIPDNYTPKMGGIKKEEK